MRLHMILPGAGPGSETIGTGDLAAGARRVEEAGFDGAWAFDAFNRGFVLPDPLIALSVAATVTSRIEIGTCILQLGLRNPVELATRVMTTRLVCGDRLSLGVGPGSTEADFHAAGVPYEERRARFDAALELIPRLVRGEAVDGVDLKPWPAVRTGPRILIGSWARPDLIKRAATEYSGWIASAAKGGRLAEGIARYRAEGGERALVTNIPVDLDGPDEPRDPDRPLDLVCTPRRARERLAWLADLGFDDVIVRTARRDERVLAAIRELV
ncbi:MAG: LLM class flavin-dependent oxidoreductase [Streptosporangiales bacterium]|nr:LLM class flavin-dependent oxidoreductase [Streptosporangiales bacterium]